MPDLSESFIRQPCGRHRTAFQAVAQSVPVERPVQRAGATISILLLVCLAQAAPPASQPATAPVDPALARTMQEIDARVAEIKSLSAEFEQKKFTALLRKPLVSAGHVLVKGTVMRWDTVSPSPTNMLIGEHEVRMYYPDQATLEIYPVDRRLAELAASPLPRLATLRQFFSFERAKTSDLDPAADDAHYLALRLLPIDPALREHVQQVLVLLDISRGFIVKAEMTDSDGDQTVIAFRNLQTGTVKGDLDLQTPPGTKVTRPLEGLGDGGAAPGRSSPP